MLYLLPNLLLSDLDHKNFLPKAIDEIMTTLDGIIAENEKEARKYLKRFALKKAIQEFPIFLLNEHTLDDELQALLEPVERGQIVGLISDAGLPCIADPGSKLVHLAHKKNIEVQALVGPSAILMSLQMSGFVGQRFTFHGYLPREEKLRRAAILALELDAQKYSRTQIFIETPYRNQELLAHLLAVLQPTTELCVAVDLTGISQCVRTKTIKEWKSCDAPSLQKRPAIFLVQNAP